MGISRICAKHRRLYPQNERCPLCKREKAEREKPRRQANKVRLGRSSAHWIAISKQARARQPFSSKCRRPEIPGLPKTQLTVHLIGGGDHRSATLNDVVVLCRRCHGRQDGGKGPIAP